MLKSGFLVGFVLAVLACLGGGKLNLESLQISNILYELVRSPQNGGKFYPEFSWIVTSSRRGSVQYAYRIEVGANVSSLVSTHPDLWNSGKVYSSQTLRIPFSGQLPPALAPIFYKITIWDNFGDSVVSKINQIHFDYPAHNEWKAKWIGSGPVHDPLPVKGFYSGAKEEGPSWDSVHHEGRSLLLRRDFRLKEKPVRVVASVTGLGLYELYLNGKRVGDHRLSPARTPYHRQILYDTYDVTQMLKSGDNAVGIHLGNGWYNPYQKWWQEYRMQWFGSKKVILQLLVCYENGTTETILTDETWRTAPGPALYNCIYDGEIYDATQEFRGWAEAGFDDNSWKLATVAEQPRGKLVPCQMPPIRVTELITPKKITQPRSAAKIFDFGQNFTGWCSLTMKGTKGTKIRIRYSEELDASGNLDVTCNENAKATAEYTLKGDGVEEYEPHFTYFGFQYAEVSAEVSLPELIKVEGLVVHSDNLPTGTFSCDNELVNKIHSATRWSQKSNMLGYPMDCPQRDERLGWLGDAQVTAEEALFNFNMEQFYRNWLSGIRENQDAVTGDIPIISPRPYIKDEGVEWSSTYLTVVWDCYRYYGNKQLILDHYPAMSRYFQFLVGHGNGVIQPKGWIGDWGSRAKNWKEGDPESVPTAYFYLDAILLSRMAGISGKSQDSVYFAEMANKIKLAYNSNYFHPDVNSYKDGSQMANAFPLYLDLVPKGKEGLVLESLVKQIMLADGGHLTTGVLGTKYLPEALSRYGRADIAWKLVNCKGYPGWEEMLKKYNTLCEFWTLKQSHNHVMMGSIDSWFYETLAGINLSDENPAYGKTTIRPYFAEGLKRVDCSLKTVRGTLVSAWKREGERLSLTVEIPFNCRSEIWIPAPENGVVKESGVPINTKKEITLVHQTGDFNVYQIGSGRYCFEVKYPVGKF